VRPALVCAPLLTFKGRKECPSRNLLAALFLVITPSVSFACYPESLRSSIDDAAIYLNRAARASSVSEAQDYARRAYSALGDVESNLGQCNCWNPASEFGNAAIYARRARDENNPSELSDYLQRAIQGFNTGIDAINAGLCR
jgi:hypothetical protein